MRLRSLLNKIMKKLSTKPIIAILAIILMWTVYFNSPLGKDEWRSDNIDGYQFQEAPDYFQFLENKDITVFIIQELLIIGSALLLMKGLGKGKNE